jgi:hypothetical protein
MANGGVHFEVTNPKAPRYCVQPNVAEIAAKIAASAAAGTPRRTGRAAGGWETRPGYNDPGTTVVVNAVPYVRFLEYGTRRQRAHAMLGRAMAAGG